MKKKQNRVLSIVLTVCMLAATFVFAPLNAAANDNLSPDTLF